MNLSYDPTVDALTLRLSAAPVEESDEVAPGVILDYDENGQVLGIEVLDVSKRAGSATSIKSVLQPRAEKQEIERTPVMTADRAASDSYVRLYPAPPSVISYAEMKVSEVKEQEVASVISH